MITAHRLAELARRGAADATRAELAELVRVYRAAIEFDKAEPVRFFRGAGGETNVGDLLILEEVAELTRANIETVRFWIKEGKLRSLRPGRRRLVRRLDLESFLADVERSRARKAVAPARKAKK
jgi:excisionase family DNA binding protein